LKYILALLLFFSLQAKAADPILMTKIMYCESNLKHINVWGDGGNAYGIAQFHKDTFYEFAHLAKKEMIKNKMWPANWLNREHQIFLLAWGLDNGYERRWTCYRKIMKEKKHLKYE
jgi:hypothetical protein